MLDFVILDIDLALNKSCLRPGNQSAHALRYDFVFWKKPLSLVSVVVSKYAVFMSILRFQCLLQVHRYKYLQDYRRPFSRCQPNKKWWHIALPCYNESEKELFIWNG